MKNTCEVCVFPIIVLISITFTPEQALLCKPLHLNSFEHEELHEFFSDYLASENQY